MKIDKPLVCFIEDCPFRIDNIAEAFVDSDYVSSYEISFIVCEQHYWDQFGDDQRFCSSADCQILRNVSLYDRQRDGIPAIFFVDMMLEWTSVYYSSGRIRTGSYPLDEAGLRIVKDLEFSFPSCSRPVWWIWTAVDCCHIDQSVANRILYKDQEPLSELFKFAETTVRKDSRSTRYKPWKSSQRRNTSK